MDPNDDSKSISSSTPARTSCDSHKSWRRGMLWFLVRLLFRCDWSVNLLFYAFSNIIFSLLEYRKYSEDSIRDEDGVISSSNRLSDASNSAESNYIKRSISRLLSHEMILSQTSFTSIETLKSVEVWMLFLDSIYFDVFSDTVAFIIGSLFLYWNHSTYLFAFICFTVMESLMKIFVKGFYDFRRHPRTMIDAISTLLLLLQIVFIHSIPHDEMSTNVLAYFIRGTVLARLLCYSRNGPFIFGKLGLVNGEYRRAFIYATRGAYHLFIVKISVLFI
jgi:hypothetical protein